MHALYGIYESGFVAVRYLLARFQFHAVSHPGPRTFGNFFQAQTGKIRGLGIAA